MTSARYGAKVPPYRYPYPYLIGQPYNDGPSAPTLHHQQAPVGPPPIPGFQDQPYYPPPTTYWNPNGGQDYNHWGGPNATHPNPNPHLYPHPYQSEYSMYPPMPYTHNASWDGRTGPSNHGLMWTQAQQRPNHNFPPNSALTMAPINHPPTQSHEAHPRNGFPLQARPPTSEVPNRHPPSASTPYDGNARSRSSSSSSGTHNLTRSHSHWAPPEALITDIPPAILSRRTGTDDSELIVRHEPSDSRSRPRPLKSILRNSSTRVPSATPSEKRADTEVERPLASSSKSKGKAKAQPDSMEDSVQKILLDPAKAVYKDTLSSYNYIMPSSDSQSEREQAPRPPTPGVIMRDPSFEDHHFNRNRYMDRDSESKKIRSEEPSSKLPTTRNKAKSKLIDLLIPDVSHYPSIDWDVSLSVYRAKKWTAQRHCVPLSKVDLRLDALDPPVNEVFIFTAKLGTPLSLVFNQWGPIHIESRPGSSSVTIEDILLGIHRYFSKCLTQSEMRELDDTAVAKVVDSRNKRWIAAGKSDPERADVIASTDPLRADELFGYLNYAGLAMDTDFQKSKMLYLKLENPVVKRRQ